MPSYLGEGVEENQTRMPRSVVFTVCFSSQEAGELMTRQVCESVWYPCDGLDQSSVFLHSTHCTLGKGCSPC